MQMEEAGEPAGQCDLKAHSEKRECAREKRRQNGGPWRHRRHRLYTLALACANPIPQSSIIALNIGLACPACVFYDANDEPETASRAHWNLLPPSEF